MIFGVLADTQTLLSPQEITALKKAFKGVDAILHAGPVGEMRVLEQLEKIAPTRAVCGNAEQSYVRSDLYVRQAWKIGPVTMGLVHGYGKPHGLKKWILKQFEEIPVQVLVYGRNFEPTARQIGTHYFFSPGSFMGNLGGESLPQRAPAGGVVVCPRQKGGWPGRDCGEPLTMGIQKPI